MRLPRGDRIKLLRQLRRISVRRLAAKVGVSATAIYDWEANKWNPNDENLWRLSRVLQVPVYVLASPPPPEQDDDEDDEEGVEFV